MHSEASTLALAVNAPIVPAGFVVMGLAASDERRQRVAPASPALHDERREGIATGSDGTAGGTDSVSAK